MRKSVLRSGLSAGLALLLCNTPALPAQGAQQAAGPSENPPRFSGGATRGGPVSFENSPRVRELIRSGNLYLSLSDALALAIENNLDIELQRLSFPAADSDVLRARGGGTLRGVQFILAEAPAGVGGPQSPLVTNPASASSVTPGTAVATNPLELGVLGEVQTNLSVQGTLPQSIGTPVTIFDPAAVGLVNWAHQTTPQTNTAVTGTNSAISNIGTVTAGVQEGFSTGPQAS